MMAYAHQLCHCSSASTWMTTDRGRRQPRACGLCERPCEECVCRTFKTLESLAGAIAGEVEAERTMTIE